MSVPQILGPLLFLLYINDLPNASDQLNFILVQMTPMSFSLINQSSLCYLLPTLNLSMWRNGLRLINFLLTWEKLIMSFSDLIGNPSPLLIPSSPLTIFLLF